MIWIILVVNALLVYKVYHDYNAMHKEKRIINHLKSSIIDGIIYVATVFIFIHPFSVLVYIGWLIVMAGYRWLVFDIAFNLVNGWKWDHDGKSADLDIWFRKLKGWDLVLKLGAIAGGILLIVL